MENIKYEQISEFCRGFNRDHFCVLEWDGEIVEDNIDEFNKILNDSVDNYKNIIFEFSKVSFCISKAVGTIAVSIKKLKSKNGRLIFVNPTQRVLAVLKITKLIDMVTVLDSVEEALKKI